VFAFVSQHTSHGVYRSLKHRGVVNWKRVSLVSMVIAYSTTVCVGSFAYFTFWDETSSDLFTTYPAGKAVNAAKMLLSVTMLLTFPMPFFTCRELFLVYWEMLCEDREANHDDDDDDDDDDDKSEEGAAEQQQGLEQLLLPALSQAAAGGGSFDIYQYLSDDGHNASGGLQLKTRYHVAITLLFWGFSVAVALAAPTLGDVLNIVGCASGSMVAFILPAIIARATGDKGLGTAAMLVLGVAIAILGTAFAVRSLVS